MACRIEKALCRKTPICQKTINEGGATLTRRRIVFRFASVGPITKMPWNILQGKLVNVVDIKQVALVEAGARAILGEIVRVDENRIAAIG